MTDEIKINWIPPISVSNSATKDELRFVFKQAEKRVEETAKEGDSFYNKSIALVTICLTILSALISYSISNFKFSPQIFAAIPVGVMLTSVISKLKNNVIPARYLGAGTYPNVLLSNAFYENLEPGKDSEWYMLMNEIIMYQERLEINVKNNNKRKDCLINCYNILYAIPIVVTISLAIYLLIYVSSHP